MNDLVKIGNKLINNEEVSSVDARELHEKLQVKNYFRSWIQRRLKEAQAIEGQDFIKEIIQDVDISRSAKMRSDNSGHDKASTTQKRNNDWDVRIEYYVTLDIAKHIAMLEKTELGRQIRQYFIEVEKRVKRPPVVQLSAKEMAKKDLKIYLDFALECQVPESIALTESAAIVDRKYGTEITKAINKSKLLENITEEDIYLEPTDLGKLLGISGKAMNQKLKGFGLQIYMNNTWVPTPKAESYYVKHCWTTPYKQGYNLKWNKTFVLELLK